MKTSLPIFPQLHRVYTSLEALQVQRQQHLQQQQQKQHLQQQHHLQQQQPPHLPQPCCHHAV